VKFFDSFGSGGFYRVGDGENSRRLSIHGHEHRGSCPFLEVSSRRFQRIQTVTFSFRRKSGFQSLPHDQRRCRQHHLPSPNENLSRPQWVSSAPSRLHNRGGERVFAVLFQ